MGKKIELEDRNKIKIICSKILKVAVQQATDEEVSIFEIFGEKRNYQSFSNGRQSGYFPHDDAILSVLIEPTFYDKKDINDLIKLKLKYLNDEKRKELRALIASSENLRIERMKKRKIKKQEFRKRVRERTLTLLGL